MTEHCLGSNQAGHSFQSHHSRYHSCDPCPPLEAPPQRGVFKNPIQDFPEGWLLWNGVRCIYIQATARGRSQTCSWREATLLFTVVRSNLLVPNWGAISRPTTAWHLSPRATPFPRVWFHAVHWGKSNYLDSMYLPTHTQAQDPFPTKQYWQLMIGPPRPLYSTAT